MATSRKAHDGAAEIAKLYESRGPLWRERAMDVELRTPAAGEPMDDGLIPVTMSSEAPVERYDWMRDMTYTEVLDHTKVDLSYARDGLPFLVDHDTTRQVGLVEQVTVDPATGTLRGLIRQGNHPDAAWVFKDIRAGIRKKVSIGYLQGEYTSTKNRDGAETRKMAFMPIENSSVPIPADYEVGTGRSLLEALRTPAHPRLEASPLGTKETTMPEPAIETPPDGVALEKERQFLIRKYCKANGVPAEKTLEFLELETTTLGAVREWVKVEMTKENATETRGIRTGASGPDIVMVSPKGPLDRNGQVKQDEATFGFDSAGEFYQAVAQRTIGRGNDPRLNRAAAAGQSEAVSSDGGFLLPPEFLNQITAPLYKTGSVLSEVRRMTISSNTLNIQVIDETSRANGSRFGAVQASWVDEADAVGTAGKIKYRRHTLNTKKLIAKAFVTDEQLEDTASITSTLPIAFGEELRFMVEDAIFNGNGNGQPVGIISHASVVSQAIEAAQTIANTPGSFVANTSKMYSRVPPGLLAGCKWYMNIDFFPTLQQATLGSTSAVAGVYLPGGNISGTPFGTLHGLPIVFTEYNLAVGTPGDILLANLGQYMLVEKASGINMQTSAHVNFLTDELAFRFTYRVDGQPTWKTALTPYKGTNTKSPFVTLAVRV